MNLCFVLNQILLLVFKFTSTLAINDILAAINAGGPEHVDVFGIRYSGDSLRTGIPSDYGRRYLIGRVDPQDQILYQTERYNIGNFEYTLDLEAKDGDYVLVLKFSEVYFGGPDQKVFNVEVNDHTVVHDLDIFAQVGRAIAYDEIVPFTIKSGKLHIANEMSDFDGTFVLRFVQGRQDNPKVNAFYIMKGTPEDVPPMPPLEQPEEDELMTPRRQEQMPEEDEPPEVLDRYASGPQVADPYAQQEVSQMFIPILIALACFFPVLFCLCRL